MDDLEDLISVIDDNLSVELKDKLEPSQAKPYPGQPQAPPQEYYPGQPQVPYQAPYPGH